jgi:hypothetical protein
VRYSIYNVSSRSCCEHLRNIHIPDLRPAQQNGGPPALRYEKEWCRYDQENGSIYSPYSLNYVAVWRMSDYDQASRTGFSCGGCGEAHPSCANWPCALAGSGKALLFEGLGLLAFG